MNLAGLGTAWDMGDRGGGGVRDGLGHRRRGQGGHGRHRDHVGFEMSL